ncbi:hypothetical protein [Streptomyces coriariae]|uniref:hypothetical protein n=1 Tax=Streptomyces coriariae TaxID=2864460 RepID=UPI001E63E2D9|nr:hypothetical protein [Streptomyces coriariae]
MLPSTARRIRPWMPLISGSELVKVPAEALSVRLHPAAGAGLRRLRDPNSDDEPDDGEDA